MNSGSNMRTAFCRRNSLMEAVRLSSVVTHSHYLAVQGVALQAAAVAIATRGSFDAAQFLRIVTEEDVILEINCEAPAH